MMKMGNFLFMKKLKAQKEFQLENISYSERTHFTGIWISY